MALAACMMIFTIVSVATFDRADRNLFGFKAFIVLSDSMKKTDFNAGDLVLVKEVDPSTLKEGDIIAYTSQLAHVVSSAYIKSPTMLREEGYSAGSFRDLTRVARLDEKMWTDLFLRNADFLVDEIDEIIKHLREYRDVLHDHDAQTLEFLLKDGRVKKEWSNDHVQ